MEIWDSNVLANSNETNQGTMEVSHKTLQEALQAFKNVVQGFEGELSAETVQDLFKMFEKHFDECEAEYERLTHGISDSFLVRRLSLDALDQFTAKCHQDLNSMLKDLHPNVVAKFEGVARSIITRFDSATIDFLRQSSNLSGVRVLDADAMPEDPHASGSFIHEKFFAKEKKFDKTAILTWVLGLFPIRKWLPKYSIKNDILGDLLAALTVGLMLVPQGMAYAMLSHLPPIYGLYAGTVPMFLYTFFGTSSELSVGPAAMVSLAIPSALESIATTDQNEYIALCTFLSLVTGLTLLIAGFMRFGFVIENLLSTPILTGFTQGAAVLIVLSQLKHLLRLPIPGSALTLPSILYAVFSDFGKIHWWTVMLGLISIIIIVLVRKISSRIPTPLIMMGITTVIVWATHAHTKLGLKIIGEIPAGFPSPALLKLTFTDMANAASPAVIVAIIGFIEAISAAKAFAARKHYKVDTSQEMIALGVANIVGSIFRSYPVGASLARTAVNFQTGSRTPLNQFFASILVSMVLFFLTKLFYYTPLFILAAIVMTGAVSLINLQEPTFLWQQKEKGDIVELYVTMIGTMLLGPILGVIIAIGLAILEFVYRSATPKVFEEGRLPQTNLYKNINIYTSATKVPGAIIIRTDTRLAFYNINHFREKIAKLEAASKEPIKCLIIDLGGVSYIDSTAIHGFVECVEDHISKNIRVLIADTKGPVKNSLDYCGLSEKITEKGFFPTVHAAVEAFVHPDQALENVVQLEDVPEEKLLNNSGQHNFASKFAEILLRNPVFEKVRETVDSQKTGWKGEKNIVWI